MGQMINCLPSATPATNGNAARKPNRAPVAISAILAGPGRADLAGSKDRQRDKGDAHLRASQLALDSSIR